MVTYIVTLLSGRARELGTAMWDADAPECQNFSHFAHIIMGVFDQSASGPATTRQLGSEGCPTPIPLSHAKL